MAAFLKATLQVSVTCACASMNAEPSHWELKSVNVTNPEVWVDYVAMFANYWETVATHISWSDMQCDVWFGRRVLDPSSDESVWRWLANMHGDSLFSWQAPDISLKLVMNKRQSCVEHASVGQGAGAEDRRRNMAFDPRKCCVNVQLDAMSAIRMTFGGVTASADVWGAPGGEDHVRERDSGTALQSYESSFTTAISQLELWKQLCVQMYRRVLKSPVAKAYDVEKDNWPGLMVGWSHSATLPIRVFRAHVGDVMVASFSGSERWQGRASIGKSIVHQSDHAAWSRKAIASICGLAEFV